MKRPINLRNAVGYLRFTVVSIQVENLQLNRLSEKVASAILAGVESRLPVRGNGVATWKTTDRTGRLAPQTLFPDGKMAAATASKEDCHYIFRLAL